VVGVRVVEVVVDVLVDVDVEVVVVELVDVEVVVIWTLGISNNDISPSSIKINP